MELEDKNSSEALDLEPEVTSEQVVLCLTQSAAGAELLALAELCKVASKGKVDVVVCRSRDSLSRDPGLQRTVLAALSDYGVKLLFTEDFGYQLGVQTY